jgi:predicted acetyltransferase
MRHVRQLTGADDFTAMVAISADAYPGIKVVTEEDRQRLQQRLITTSNEDPTIEFYGLFDDEQLRGSMRLHDFSMNMFGTMVASGGVGFVAVDLLHKKEAVAKELLEFFLRRCRERDQAMALLYPFRPDFYKKMGFGYGTKISQYRVRPANLPRGPSKAHLRRLIERDVPQVTESYNRFQTSRHGLIARSERDTRQPFGNPENKIIGYENNGRIEGYLSFTFKPNRSDSFLRNDIVVNELVYEHADALAELLTFLHTQADQIDTITFSLHDDSFHHLLFDPRNGTGNPLATLYQESNAQGVGIMYRAVDVRALFKQLADRDFGGQTCKLKLTINDGFLPENGGELVLHFLSGHVTVQDGGEFDLAISLDIAEFSALLMGVVSFTALQRYSLATISDTRAIGTVNRLFLADEKPMCMTMF